jgi:hypothetical protein
VSSRTLATSNAKFSTELSRSKNVSNFVNRINEGTEGIMKGLKESGNWKIGKSKFLSHKKTNASRPAEVHCRLSYWLTEWRRAHHSASACCCHRPEENDEPTRLFTTLPLANAKGSPADLLPTPRRQLLSPVFSAA